MRLTLDDMRLHYRYDEGNVWRPVCWKGDGAPKGGGMALMTSLTECVTCEACKEWMHA